MLVSARVGGETWPGQSLCTFVIIIRAGSVISLLFVSFSNASLLRSSHKDPLSYHQRALQTSERNTLKYIQNAFLSRFHCPFWPRPHCLYGKSQLITLQVTVGNNSQLVYEPNTVNASVGDISFVSRITLTLTSNFSNSHRFPRRFLQIASHRFKLLVSRFSSPEGFSESHHITSSFSFLKSHCMPILYYVETYCAIV